MSKEIGEVTSLFKSSNEFALDIEELVWKYDISYMDAVLHYCEENDLEIETVATLVNSNANLKAAVQADAEVLHFMPKAARLPL